MVKDPLSQKIWDWEFGLANVCDSGLERGSTFPPWRPYCLRSFRAADMRVHSQYLLSSPGSHHVSHCRLQTDSGDAVQSHL